MSIITPMPLGLVGRWATRSQEQARRNAMTACTALAARRLERLEVEEYVAAHLAALATASIVEQAAAQAAVTEIAAVRQVS
jgi:hypothetical protein